MNVQDLCMFRSISGGGGSGAGIDDNTVSSTSTWSSLKISEEMAKEHVVPTKVGDHLYEITYGNWNEADTLTYFNGKYPPFNGGCTAVRKENKIGRNFDWHYDDIAEFIINCKAHDDIHASIGIVGNVTTITDEEAASGVWKDDYIILPYRTVDGINDAGVFIEVNVVDSHDNGHTTGTNPDSDHELFTTMVVRYVLDHATSAHNAVELLQACNIRTTSAEEEYHWLISDKVYNLEVEIVDNEIKVTQLADSIRNPVVTNFFWYGWNSIASTATYNTSAWNPDTTTLNEHAVGVHRYATALSAKQDPDLTIEDVMETVKYSQYYEVDDAYDEFNGIYSGGIDLNIYSEAEDYADIISAAQEAYARHERDGSTWITCHTAIYDLDNKSLKVATQEDYDTWFVRNIAFNGTQTDWNQNDINAADYIKNRIAYDNTKYGVFKATLTSSGSLNTVDVTRDYNFESLFDVGNTAQLIVGDIVFPKTKIKRSKSNYLMFGNDSGRGGDDTGESYAVYYNAPGIPASMGLQPINGKDTSWVVNGAEVTITIEQEDIHKVDSKYLYNTDWQQNDETAIDYIKNRPGGYDTTVETTMFTSKCQQADEYEIINNEDYNWFNSDFLNKMTLGSTVQLKVGNKIFDKATIQLYGSNYYYFGNIKNWSPSKDTGEEYICYWNVFSSGGYGNFTIRKVGTGTLPWIVTGADISITLFEEKHNKISSVYIPTADWNQNNADGDGYIDNKPGMYSTYSTSQFESECKAGTGTDPTVCDTTKNTKDNNFDAIFVVGNAAQLIVGDKVFPKTLIKGTSSVPMIGNAVVRGGTDTGEPYAVYYNSVGAVSSLLIQSVTGKDNSWVVDGAEIKILAEKEVAHQVPDKYLASNIPTAGHVLTSDGNGGKTWGNLTSLNGAVKIAINMATGEQPSLNVAQGASNVTGIASANIGNGNTVTGTCSLSVGGGNKVYGASSAAIGGCVTASGDDQIAVGKYNIEDDDDEYAVIVGNGSPSSPSNALTVDWNGNVESAGDLTIHYGGQEIDVGEAITSGGGGVDDVRVDGASIVMGGVANISIATDSANGLISYEGRSFEKSGGRLVPVQTTNGRIDSRTQTNAKYYLLTLNKLDYAVKSALCDDLGAAWTDAEKAAARRRIGVSGGGGASYEIKSVTIPVASWSAQSATVSVAGVTASNLVQIAPVSQTDSDIWFLCGVFCATQAANSLTFTCTTAPTTALELKVIIWS